MWQNDHMVRGSLFFFCFVFFNRKYIQVKKVFGTIFNVSVSHHLLIRET